MIESPSRAVDVWASLFSVSGREERQLTVLISVAAEAIWEFCTPSQIAQHST